MLTSTSEWIGLQLCGQRYVVKSKLGEGGMALVYRAWDANLECDVVVKVPRRSLLDKPGAAGRFARETRSLVRLSHPHIVKVIDCGEHDGVPFAVMQYLSGGSLEDRRPKGADGRIRPISPAALNPWLSQIASALDFMHGQGFVHRDVKLGNILFDRAQNVYLSDFGIAKSLDPVANSSSTQTGEGMILGTPNYMAPEVILGEPYDGRADQYALALTVHELLTGKLPFANSNPTAILIMQTNTDLPPLYGTSPSISQGLSEAVIRALRKRPAERFSSCREFAAAVIAHLAPSSLRREPDLASGGATRTNLGLHLSRQDSIRFRVDWHGSPVPSARRSRLPRPHSRRCIT